jgi:aspartyl-tRNA(Asn)/glutamyl-tRNA(Gln) amidotransferase subunit B
VNRHQESGPHFFIYQYLYPSHYIFQILSIYSKYEAVIGLEVHLQLLTNSKAYSSDSAEYGALPNTHVSPITLGHPGTLPKANKRVVEFAVRLGLALGCEITPENLYARKNYFYADLPKGYQITQDKTPICTGGHVTIKDKDSKERQIRLTRIHMEEDAGKSIHDQDPFDSLIDLNRAGVPLLEIVSEPEIKNADEAYSYLTEIRKLVRYLDICDGNMEEGSLRCDANVSVMLKGADKFGRRVEVKNMNSIRNVKLAIEHEIIRHIDLIEAGGIVDQDTRTFDAVKGITFSLRSKEMANDYRYFPEPDLQPVLVTQNYIQKVRATLPLLPDELFKKYKKELNLSDYDAAFLTETKSIALYFEDLVSKTKNYKAAANWMMGAVKNYLNENAITISDFPIPTAQIAALIKLVDDGQVSSTVASQTIFPALFTEKNKAPLQIAQELNLIQESGTDALQELVCLALAKFPEKVAEYKSGKTGLIGLFMGEVMKLSKGKADPKIASEMMKKELEK